MKFFWDTSTAINAIISPAVKGRLNADEHVARQHLLLEFFSTMTGRGVQYKDAEGGPVLLSLDPDNAAKWLRDFAGRVALVELDKAETLAALDEAQAKSVQGARVYDYLHALAADKAGADVVLTRNRDHFEGLTRARVEWP